MLYIKNREAKLISLNNNKPCSFCVVFLRIKIYYMHMKTFDGGINMAILLSGRDLKKNFLEKEIIKNISFDIGIGDKIGIVGLNGTGKTTLANIMTGICKADDGKIS